MIAKAKKFTDDVVIEMKKVSWPTRNELRGSTMVVIVTVIIRRDLHRDRRSDPESRARASPELAYYPREVGQAKGAP